MENMIQAFSDTRKWAKILGIIFIVSFVFNLLTISIPSIIVAVVANLIPGILLIRYSQAVKEVEEAIGSATDELEQACIRQGTYFKYMGILSVIMVVLFVLGVVAAIALPSYMAFLG